MPLDTELRAERRRRLLRAIRLPMVSGRVSAAIMFALFVASAVIVIPLGRRWPPWIEAEIVLGIWWLVWMVALTYLLYTGRKVAHDHQMSEPRKWLDIQAGPRGCWSVFDGFDLLGAGSGSEGCAGALLIVLVLIVAIPLLIMLAWFVIEVAIPALAFITYLLLRGMLANVANDKHDCVGSWPRSLLWGVAWASIYIAPQALIVWVIHMVAARAHAAG